jgi:hypothetical protein
LNELTTAAGIFTDQLQSHEGGIEDCVNLVRSLLRFLRAATAAQAKELWLEGGLADKVTR